MKTFCLEHPVSPLHRYLHILVKPVKYSRVISPLTSSPITHYSYQWWLKCASFKVTSDVTNSFSCTITGRVTHWRSVCPLPYTWTHSQPRSASIAVIDQTHTHPHPESTDQSTSWPQMAEDFSPGFKFTDLRQQSEKFLLKTNDHLILIRSLPQTRYSSGIKRLQHWTQEWILN